MMPFALARGGGLLLMTASYRSNFRQPWLDGHVARFDPARQVLDTVARYPMAPHTPETGVNPYAAYGVVAGAGGGFVQARTDIPELTWRNADGDVVQIVRWRPSPRYPDQRYWDVFEESLRADLVRVNPGMPTERLQEFVDQAVARYSLDPSVPLPVFDQPVRGSADGDVWLPDVVPERGRPTRYLVVSGDGSVTRPVEFPRPLIVLDVNDEFVLGAYSNELDVLGVAVYRYSF